MTFHLENPKALYGLLALIPAIILANKSKAETGGVMCKQAKTGLVCGIIGLCFWGISLLTLLGGM